MITLTCGEQKIKVSIEYAERILRIQKKMRSTRWELPSQYQLKADGTIIKANKGVSTKSPEETGNK